MDMRKNQDIGTKMHKKKEHKKEHHDGKMAIKAKVASKDGMKEHKKEHHKK